MKTKISILIVLIISVLTGYAQQTKNMAAKNKEIAAKILKAFDDGNVNAFDGLIAKDVISHSEMPPEIKTTGLESVKEMCKMQKKAFPDIKTTIHTMGVAGDTVMVYYTTTGTNSGPFMGQPASNKKITTEGVDIIRFKNGKAVEHWGVYDNLKMMQQLGMMPPPPSPPMTPTLNTPTNPGMDKKEK